MQFFQSLSLIEWIQIITALTAVLSGVTAVIATVLSYRTIRQARDQLSLSELDIKAKYAPKIKVTWDSCDQLPNGITISLKDINENNARNALKHLNDWKKEPDQKPVPFRYHCLIIRNEQENSIAGTAIDINLSVGLDVKKKEISFPSSEPYQFIVNYPILHSNSSLVFFVEAEGIPEVTMKLFYVRYLWKERDSVLEDFSGDSMHRCPK